MFGLKEFCFLDKYLVIKKFLVEKNLDLEIILVLKSFRSEKRYGPPKKLSGPNNL